MRSLPSLGGWFLTIPHRVGSSQQGSRLPPSSCVHPRRLTWPGVGRGSGVGGQGSEGSAWGAQVPRAAASEARCRPRPQRHSSTTSTKASFFGSSDGSSVVVVVVSVFSVSDTEDTCRTQSLSLSGFG